MRPAACFSLSLHGADGLPCPSRLFLLLPTSRLLCTSSLRAREVLQSTCLHGLLACPVTSLGHRQRVLKGTASHRPHSHWSDIRSCLSKVLMEVRQLYMLHRPHGQERVIFRQWMLHWPCALSAATHIPIFADSEVLRSSSFRTSRALLQVSSSVLRGSAMCSRPFHVNSS